VDINVPVKKGHDLLHVEEDAVVQGLVDGSGAHNSPRGAIRDDGSVEGQDEVPVVVQRRGVNASQTGVENQVVGSGGSSIWQRAKLTRQLKAAAHLKGSTSFWQKVQ
jgi:hypothetical protein